MADQSTFHKRIADAGRRTYEFLAGKKVPVGSTKFKTFKTDPGEIDDPGVRRARKRTKRTKGMLEQLD